MPNLNHRATPRLYGAVSDEGNLMSSTMLVCSCGMTLKAAGARPGRVGKCPRCGALLTVPEGPVAAGYGVDPEAAVRPSFHSSPTLETSAPLRIKRTKLSADHGPVAPPKGLEKRFRESLGYPLWSWSSVAILAFLPPILSAVSAPLTVLHRVLTGGTPFSVAGLVLMIPFTIGGIFVWGYFLVFLSHVLTSSAFGERLPPRSPTFSDDDVFRVLGRWFWATLAGFAIGFVPAVAYWIQCGEIDWMDRLMLINLIAIGMAYAQMAVLAALLHDDPLASNPITVIGAIVRVGWDYAAISLLGGGFAIAMGGLLLLFLEASGSMFSVVLIWLFWLIFVYGAMFVLRCQGLFCYRHKVVLAWFRDRPTWGR
jgi:hypothetical protein